MSYISQDKCRVCGGPLADILHMNDMAMTGVFPRPNTQVECGPLTLARCTGVCGLVQLRETYDTDVMYGPSYGYRSSLNRSMIDHLQDIASQMHHYVTLHYGDPCVDIGSNDGTFLSMLPSGCKLIGIDPLAHHMLPTYPHNASIISEFFPSPLVGLALDGQRAKLVTSIACFYDLQDPVSFAKSVHDMLASDGVWYTEQVYLPDIINSTMYDTICHEHVEYYSLSSMLHILDAANLRVIDVVTNPTNGGSFGVVVAHKNSPHTANNSIIYTMLCEESALLDNVLSYTEFADRVARHKTELLSTLGNMLSSGGVIHGYGASTKGNVLLQWCNIGTDVLPMIADVNPTKHGCVTPGTNIPIVSEAESKSHNPTHYLVLPWHFHDSILRREKEWSNSGGKFVFPLPHAEIV